MIHKNKSIVGKFVALIALASLLTGPAKAQDEATGPSTQCVPFVAQSGGSGSGCPGVYTGYAKMTNSVGSVWVTPPTNTTRGTLTNLSNLPEPFVGAVCVKCNNLNIWCDTNSVTFPATNTLQYQLYIYAKSTPPPTNGYPIVLQVIWQ